MQSIKLNTYVGDDGMLQLQIPVGVTNTEMEVVVIYQPILADPSQPDPRSKVAEPIESGWADDPVVHPNPKTPEILEDMW